MSKVDLSKPVVDITYIPAKDKLDTVTLTFPNALTAAMAVNNMIRSGELYWVVKVHSLNKRAEDLYDEAAFLYS